MNKRGSGDLILLAWTTLQIVALILVLGWGWTGPGERWLVAGFILLSCAINIGCALYVLTVPPGQGASREPVKAPPGLALAVMFCIAKEVVAAACAFALAHDGGDASDAMKVVGWLCCLNAALFSYSDFATGGFTVTLWLNAAATIDKVGVTLGCNSRRVVAYLTGDARRSTTTRWAFWIAGIFLPVDAVRAIVASNIYHAVTAGCFAITVTVIQRPVALRVADTMDRTEGSSERVAPPRHYVFDARFYLCFFTVVAVIGLRQFPADPFAPLAVLWLASPVGKWVAIDQSDCGTRTLAKDLRRLRKVVVPRLPVAQGT